MARTSNDWWAAQLSKRNEVQRDHLDLTRVEMPLSADLGVAVNEIATQSGQDLLARLRRDFRLGIGSWPGFLGLGSSRAHNLFECWTFKRLF